ncbi:hypothetical protein KM043_013716 [Ampulex compressa]|nr:hypothetical protein KM043_013716 [Ampulex compressa]
MSSLFAPRESGVARANFKVELANGLNEEFGRSGRWPATRQRRGSKGSSRGSIPRTFGSRANAIETRVNIRFPSRKNPGLERGATVVKDRRSDPPPEEGTAKEGAFPIRIADYYAVHRGGRVRSILFV